MSNEDNDQKLFWYCFVFIYGNTTVSHYAGFIENRITLHRINKAKKECEAPASAVMLSASFLGEMTSDEFKSNSD